MSRQNYYARRRWRQRREVDEDLILSWVREERALQPRLGTRKLLKVLAGRLQREGLRLGRDRLFELLRQRGLLVEPLPAEYPHTTHSQHSLPVYGNQVAGLEIRRPHQVLVADLTYVRTEKHFVYLSLVTDAKSRKIVGYHCADNLQTEGCLRALKMALAQLPTDAQTIHHSDRGCQYCSRQYIQELQKRGLQISMTERNHSAENALAERVNGILKQEYGLGRCFQNQAQVEQAVEQAIELYNHRRPHLALNYQVPEEVHRQAA